MGDRALVIFTDNKGKEISPTVYLHWGGDSVPQLLKELSEFMAGRFNDVQYGCARFIGLAHTMMNDTNLSLGVWNTDEDLQKTIKNLMLFHTLTENYKREIIEKLNSESHGDAGLFIVNVEDYSWRCFGGYHSNVTVP